MKSIDEFEKVVNHIYGVYLDSLIGFEKLRDWFQTQQQDILNYFKRTSPELADIHYLDRTDFIYGKGDPNSYKAVELHRCTQRDFKDRISEDGKDIQFLGNMGLVSLYQYWEDFFRKQIALELGIKKNELKAPIMGDLRLLRQSIIHHAGIALKSVEKCEILTWYKEGEKIFIDRPKFEKIILCVKGMTSALRIRKNGFE